MLWQDRFIGERTSYPNGTFSWVENATTDQDSAKRFYSTLFGWDYDDNPVGDGVVYSMAKLGGQFVAAVSPQMQDERAMGVPPHWNSYITVDDVDAVSGRIAQLGGTLHAGPFDVLEVGRMSAFSDPTGAVAYLWQARSHIGAGLVNAPGAFCWNDLATNDPDSAQQFYAELLGWTYDKVPIPDMDYWSVKNDGRPNGGMRREDQMQPHWLVYFAVDNIAASSESAAGAGAQVVMPTVAAGGQNKFAVLRDPVGAAFGLFEGQLDD